MCFTQVFYLHDTITEPDSGERGTHSARLASLFWKEIHELLSRRLLSDVVTSLL
jgi:hypothetical protein